MSAVSAARKRRAGPLPAEPIRNTSIPQSNNSVPLPAARAGLTLPEVIALVDKRLVTLEKFMNDTKSQTNDVPREPKIKFEFENSEESSPSFTNEIIEEFNSRFVLLTEEMTALKDIILNLQSYTMSVNKVLMEERIQIISDLGTIVEEGEEGEGEEEEEGEIVESGESGKTDEIYDSVTNLNNSIGQEESSDSREESALNKDVNENGMTKYGIPIPEKIPRYQPKSVKFA